MGCRARALRARRIFRKDQRGACRDFVGWPRIFIDLRSVLEWLEKRRAVSPQLRDYLRDGAPLREPLPRPSLDDMDIILQLSSDFGECVVDILLIFEATTQTARLERTVVL